MRLNNKSKSMKNNKSKVIKEEIKNNEESFLMKLEFIEKFADSLDYATPPPIIQIIIDEIEKRGLAKLDGMKDLSTFLKEYPKEKYETDIIPILICALQNS